MCSFYCLPLNKKKIFNDPVYGFITIQHDIVFDLLSHKYFQRLRNIKQLGLTHLVYPGALHTRFHHALGAMHLMQIALDSLRNKGVLITEEEAKAANIAILLHDIGHGPYSHALENCIVPGVHHEHLSSVFMKKLNEEFNGELTIAIQIFENSYTKKFLHQLVSGQLDMDRLDYLNRDSFYTGVSEGVIGFDRILKMINVVDDELVVEEKGIYSIEKFLIARRLMYWQVYLHKTVIAAEQLLVKILMRAKELSLQGSSLFASPAFTRLLKNNYTLHDFEQDQQVLEDFAKLDDHDIYTSIKVWAEDSDPLLAMLCQKLISRELLAIEIQNEPFMQNQIAEQQSIQITKGFQPSDLPYLVFTGSIINNAYNPMMGSIKIMQKNNQLIDVAKASDGLNIEALSREVEKYYLCFPKHNF